MRRTLRLTSPYMKGPDVKTAQQHLVSRGYLARGQADGEFGPITANAAKRAKYAIGYRLADVRATYGSMLDDFLLGKRKPSKAMRLRAANRRRKPVESVGAKAADTMVGWYKAGWKEHPAGSNYVLGLSDVCKHLGLASYYSNMGFPWCALTVFVAALSHESKSADYGLRRGLFNALYTPEIQAVANRGSFGLSAISKSAIKKGSGVLFDFDGGGVDHIGLALGAPGVAVFAGGKTWRPSASQVVCVEGNTSYDGGGSQSNGGCVAVRIRDLSLIATAFRLT